MRTTTTRPSIMSILPIIALGLFALMNLINDIEPDEPKQRKPRTLTFDEVVQKDINGKYQLHPNRLRKLRRDIENLNNAEQYALKAKSNGWFSCLSCPYRDSIYLYKNEIWKYGVTINGEVGRYRNRLKIKGLQYKTQYTGTIEQCMIEERKKIIKYPLLRENLQRKKPIARPPGNPKDS